MYDFFERMAGDLKSNGSVALTLGVCVVVWCVCGNVCVCVGSFMSVFGRLLCMHLIIIPTSAPSIRSLREGELEERAESAERALERSQA